MKKEDKINFVQILKDNNFYQTVALFGTIVGMSADHLRKLYRDGKDRDRFFKLLEVAAAQWNHLIGRVVTSEEYVATVSDLFCWEKVVYSDPRQFIKHFIKEPVITVKGVWWSSTKMSVNCLAESGDEKLFIIDIDSWFKFYEGVVK